MNYNGKLLSYYLHLNFNTLKKESMLIQSIATQRQINRNIVIYMYMTAEWMERIMPQQSSLEHTSACMPCKQ